MHTERFSRDLENRDPISIPYRNRLRKNEGRFSLAKKEEFDYGLEPFEKQRIEESEYLKEEEYDPTKIELEVLDEAEPIEPEAKPDVETPMFRAQPPSPDLRDELSKLMDIMQHMQWQQQAYWRYSKIRDDSMRSAFKKIYNDLFIFVPVFPGFIFEP
ncbi:hypothetical protein J1N35_005662 [Gossypium stocksii]|uniref:Uncharacterized protein n=1 Tax=Gossypium stocksii TaxID=47602 RepID=A0A9D3WEB0_9ROSI|nr:hypothetical protein J1N35_005662 [Gossypium stocksii]